MAKKKKYRLKKGEHIRAVARRFGFSSLKPIEDEPDNADIIAERGGVEKLKGGDRITIPPAKTGKSLIATGKHHAFAIPFSLHTLEIRLYSEFRLSDPEAPEEDKGDKAKTKNRCEFLGQQGGHSGFFQIDAKVELMEMDPSTGVFHVAHETETRVMTAKGGLTDLLAASICELPAPSASRVSFLRISPVRPEETSNGPARANKGVDHGTAAGSWLPSRRLFHHEYRPLEIDVTVFNREIFSAGIHGDPAPSRPHHATLFWKNIGESWGRMILEVDWRPDFLRRVRSSVKPLPRNRIRDIDMVVVHHTGGPVMGSQLNTFLNQTKGAHFIIDLDGHVVRVADDKYNTKHGAGGAGRTPNWDGRKLINHRAVGIENCHGFQDNLDLEKNPYTEAQYAALIDVIHSLRDAYGPRGSPLSPRHVVGHHDVSVGHVLCPGAHLDWERLEAAGQALAPEGLTQAEIDSMFGGFFAGTDGSGRRIEIGDGQRGGPTEFKLRKKGGVEIDKLTAGPITELRQALENIGYAPGRRFGDFSRSRTKFEGVTAYCVTQFMKHFCTGSRVRKDQAKAYRESPRIPDDLFIDFDLAKLIKEVEKAALANP